MSDFFKTRAGMQLTGGTLPRIAEALERIATALETQNKLSLEAQEIEEEETGAIGDRTSL